MAAKLAAVLKEHMPFLGETLLFKDENELVNYMSKSEYKDNKNTGLCMGISFNQETNGRYEYTLTTNFTGG